jgi:hypothetical protein
VEVFDQCSVYVDGELDSYAVEVTVGIHDNDQIVTVLGGGSSKTMTLAPGGRTMSIQWSSAVPQANHNLRLWQKYVDCEQVTLRVVQQGGGFSLTSKGFLQAPSISAHVGGNQSASNAFVGEVATWI